MDKASARYVHRMKHGEDVLFDALNPLHFKKLNIYNVRAKGVKDEFSVPEQVCLVDCPTESASYVG